MRFGLNRPDSKASDMDFQKVDPDAERIGTSLSGRLVYRPKPLPYPDKLPLTKVVSHRFVFVLLLRVICFLRVHYTTLYVLDFVFEIGTALLQCTTSRMTSLVQQYATVTSMKYIAILLSLCDLKPRCLCAVLTLTSCGVVQVH